MFLQKNFMFSPKNNPKRAQDFHFKLPPRMNASKSHLITRVGDEFEKYEKGEWVVLVRSAARKIVPDMAD